MHGLCASDVLSLFLRLPGEMGAESNQLFTTICIIFAKSGKQNQRS